MSRAPNKTKSLDAMLAASDKQPTPEVVVEPTIVDTPQEYPEAHDLTSLYAAGLLPSNNVPAVHTMQAVAAEAASGKPIAVLVDGTGEVLPAPIPYIVSPSAKPLYTTDEVERYQKIYETNEKIRVHELLRKNAKPAYDHTAVPVVEETSAEDDLYGEPMSQSVAAAFPRASKK